MSGRMSKKRKNKFDEASPMFDENTEDEEFKKYKRKAYRKLILSALLAFVLGLLVKFLLLR